MELNHPYIIDDIVAILELEERLGLKTLHLTTQQRVEVLLELYLTLGRQTVDDNTAKQIANDILDKHNLKGKLPMNTNERLERKDYYAYECGSGCGHITLTDKRYKTKRTHCAICGEKSEMIYLGEYTIKAKRDPRFIDLGLSPR